MPATIRGINRILRYTYRYYSKIYLFNFNLFCICGDNNNLLISILVFVIVSPLTKPMICDYFLGLIY